MSSLLDNIKYENSPMNYQPVSSQKNESVLSSKSVDIPNDSVTLSTPKKSNVQKKLLIGAGSVLAVGISVFAGVKMYQKHFISVAQKTFKSIYMRDDITKEETKQILRRFKEIEKIEDKEEYIKALFKEIKNNYGLGETNIKLVMKEGNYHGKTVPTCSGLNDNINIPLSCKRGEIRSTLHHEFRHAKQNDTAYNYSPVEFFKKQGCIKPEDVEALNKQVDEAISKGIFKSAEEMLDGKSAEEYLADMFIEKYGQNFTRRELSGKEKKFAQKILKSSYHPVTENYKRGDSTLKFFKFLKSGLQNMTTAKERDAYWAQFKSILMFKTMPKDAV